MDLPTSNGEPIIHQIWIVEISCYQQTSYILMHKQLSKNNYSILFVILHLFAIILLYKFYVLYLVCV